MKKTDLRTGMRVKTRSGKIFLVIKDIETMGYGHQDVAFVNNGFLNGTEYSDDLIHENFRDFDIVEVFNSCKEGAYLIGELLKLEEKYSIWKRQEFSNEQKEIFKALKMLGYNYITRDLNYDIYAYEKKPTKKLKYHWSSDDIVSFELETSKILNAPHLNFIDWYDEEPFEIPEVE